MKTRWSSSNIDEKVWLNGILWMSMQALVITVLALSLSFIMIDWLDVYTYMPSSKATDFQMSDMYNAVANRRAVRQLDNDIVIITTDDCSRIEIAELITKINDNSPAAIGIDIFFPYTYSDDSILLASLCSCDNLVLPLHVVDSIAEKKKFSFFDGMVNAQYGCVNLELANIRSTLRDFHPYYQYEGGTVPNFAVTLAGVKDSSTLRTLKNREGNTEIIYFPSVDFVQLEGKRILYDDELQLEQLKGKIVLMGDAKNPNDLYLTPLDAAMPGILIHAHTLHTILSNKYVSVSKKWVNWMIAILVCFFFSFINLIAKKSFGKLGNFLMRILQFLTMYILFAIGCFVFASNGLYIDFTPSMLIIGLGAVAFDVWYGLYVFSLKIKSMFQTNK